MKIYISLKDVDENVRRVDGWSISDFEGSFEIDLYNSHPFFDNYLEWVVINDVLLKDGSYYKACQEKQEKIEESNRVKQEIFDNIDTILKDNEKTIGDLQVDLNQSMKMSEDLLLLVFDLMSQLGINPLDAMDAMKQMKGGE